MDCETSNMFRSVFRATQVLFDGRNRFPINIKLTQTRKRNDRKRLAIMQENAAIIREGRRALMRRLIREKNERQTAADGIKIAASSGSADSVDVHSATASAIPTNTEKLSSEASTQKHPNL